MTEENFVDEIKTEWSGDSTTLFRVDSYLKECAHCFTNNDLIGWYKALEKLRKEAIVEMKKDKRLECNKMFDLLMRNIYFYSRTKKNNGKVFFELVRQMNNTEIFIRDSLKEKGLLMRDAKGFSTRYRTGALHG